MNRSLDRISGWEDHDLKGELAALAMIDGEDRLSQQMVHLGAYAALQEPRPA